ncbi:MAG: DUF4367 domain-containing protein [Peptococcaceae bacterium]|nr:DUF4367 domain-containing protein [Peptococcaceae bacterium]
MPKYTDEQIDNIIREIIQERMKNADPPPAEEAWQRFQQRLMEREKAKNRIHLGPFHMTKRALVACILLFFAASLSIAYPERLTAIGNSIYYTVRTVTVRDDNTVNIAIGRYKDNPPPGITEKMRQTKLPPATGHPPPPPPDTESGFTSGVSITSTGPETGEAAKVVELSTPSPRKGLSLEEVRAIAPFMVRAPGYVPARFKLKDITYRPYSDLAGEVTFEYRTASGDHILISQQFATGDVGMGLGFDRDDTVVKEVDIKGNEGLLLEHKGGKYCSLHWFDNASHFRVSGRLSPEEILKVARSM